MAYIDQFERQNRTGPIAGVIAIHAGIGYLLVTGLAGGVFKEIIPDDFGAVEFPTKPVEEPDDPEPVSEPAIDQKIQAPVPPLDLTIPKRIEVEPATLPSIDKLLPIPTPKTVPIPETTPTLAFDPVAPRPRNDPARWVTTDDYPSAEIRRGNEGTARFRLEIAANGKVESCTITRSSGFERLDAATCRNVERRAKFEPARDSSDRPVAGRYESSVRWVLPQ